MVKMKNPGSVKLPDGKFLKYTHVTNLDIPGLDQKATKSYVVPKLKNTPLLSIGQLCDEDYVAIFTKNQVKIVPNKNDTCDK